MQRADPSRPRGRPRQFDPGLVLDQAIEVFWQKGYEGASLDDLTVAMGLSRPSVYAAFGDKRGLFLAALERYIATQGSEPLEALRREPDAATGVRAFLSAVLDLAVQGSVSKGCLIACVASEIAACDPDIRARVARAITGTESAIAAYLGPKIGAQPEPLAHLLVALMQSLAIRARAGAARGELDEIAAAAAAPLLRLLTLDRS